MGWFSKEARAARKAKKAAKRDPYDILEEKLQKKLIELDVDDEEFGEVQSKLKSNNIMRAESRESKRKISKQDKGGIIIKVLSILGAGAGIGSIIWAEHQGMVFTGEKRSIMDAIARGIGQVFVRKS